MSCPRCLRAFPNVLVKKAQVIHEASCFYCGATISYAIVPPNDSPKDMSVTPADSHGTVDIYCLSTRPDLLSTGHHDSN